MKCMRLTSEYALGGALVVVMIGIVVISSSKPPNTESDNLLALAKERNALLTEALSNFTRDLEVTLVEFGELSNDTAVDAIVEEIVHRANENCDDALNITSQQLVRLRECLQEAKDRIFAILGHSCFFWYISFSHFLPFFFL